jgi:hypothetical protein
MPGESKRHAESKSSEVKKKEAPKPAEKPSKPQVENLSSFVDSLFAPGNDNLPLNVPLTEIAPIITPIVVPDKVEPVEGKEGVSSRGFSRWFGQKESSFSFQFILNFLRRSSIHSSSSERSILSTCRLFQAIECRSSVCLGSRIRKTESSSCFLASQWWTSSSHSKASSRSGEQGNHRICLFHLFPFGTSTSSSLPTSSSRRLLSQSTFFPSPFQSTFSAHVSSSAATTSQAT